MVPTIRSPLRRLTLGLLLASACGYPAVALEVRDLFSESRIDGARPQQPRVSPDGRLVAFFWNVQGKDEPLDLYVAQADSGRPVRWSDLEKETFFEPRKQVWPRSSPLGGADWSPDGRQIAFSYRGDLFIGEGPGRAQRLTRTLAAESDPRWLPGAEALIFLGAGGLTRIDLETGRTSDLTNPPEPVPVLLGFEVAPDGSRIAVLAHDAKGQEEVLVPYYLDEAVSVRSHPPGATEVKVGIVEAVGGEIHWVAAGDEPFGAVDRLAWSPDSLSLLIDATAPDLKRRALRVVEAGPGVAGSPGAGPPAAPLAARRVYREEDPFWIEVADAFAVEEIATSFSRDGSRILFLSEKSGWRQAYTVPASGGEPEPLGHGEGEVSWATWGAEAGAVVMLTNAGNLAERHLVRVDTSGARRPLDPGPGTVSHPRLSQDGRRVVYFHSRFGVPSDLWAASTAAGGAKLARISETVPAAFRKVDWSVPEIVTFPARDGGTLRGLVYPPRGAGRHPVVVFVHGAGIMQNVLNGWTYYSRNFMFHTLLIERGFLVFEVDYRGSTGYGREFRAGVLGHIGGKDLDDELAGIDYLRGRGDVDPARIGIYGGSYGGFMALMGLFRHPDVYAAGAALRFVADWRSYHRGNPVYCRQRLGKPEENAEAYRISSPIEFASGLTKPLLLLHGVLDSNVPFQDCVRLVDTLLAAGKKPELMIYPREDHGFTEAASWIDQYGRILEFFERHLKAPRG